MSRPTLDERLLQEMHAAFESQIKFVERASSASFVEGADGGRVCVYNLGIARTAVTQLSRAVVTLPKALISYSGVQPFAGHPLALAFEGYLALRWCFNARVDAGALLGQTAYGPAALTGLASGIMDDPARLAWDQVPWDRLAYALHLAAAPLGLALDPNPPTKPEGWEP